MRAVPLSAEEDINGLNTVSESRSQRTAARIRSVN